MPASRSDQTITFQLPRNALKIAGIAFCDADGEKAAFEDMAGRWPNARFVADREATAAYAGRVFDPARWRADPHRS